MGSKCWRGLSALWKSFAATDGALSTTRRALPPRAGLAGLPSAERLESRQMLLASPAGGEFLASATYAAADRQQVASSPSGDYVVTWAQSDTGNSTNTDIYARRYNFAGAAQGAAFRVNTVTAGSQASPSVAVDGAGNFLVVWTGTDGAGDGIIGQRFNAAGTPQGGEFFVNVTGAGEQFSPSAASDGAGSYVVAWNSTPATGTAVNVVARRFDNAGTALSGEVPVSTTGGLSFAYLSVANNRAGDFVVGWTRLNLTPTPTTQLVARKIGANGTPQTGEIIVSSGEVGFPSVGMDAAGNFTAVWTGQDASGAGIVGQRYNAAGAAQGGPFVVNTTTAGSQGNPAAAMDPDGNLIVAWESNATASNADVFVREYRAGGVADARGERRVNTTTTGDQLSVSVAASRRADFVVTWQSTTGAPATTGVYGQRYRILDGDVDRDGVVGVGDLGILSTNYDRPSGATFGQGDIDGDGAVGVGDLGILSTNYDRTLPASFPASAGAAATASAASVEPVTAAVTTASTETAAVTAPAPVAQPKAAAKKAAAQARRAAAKSALKIKRLARH